jgi:cell division protein FtsL
VSVKPLQEVNPDRGLRVLQGKGIRRPTMAPWMIMAVIGVIAFLGLGFARTSLDRSAFELAELNKAIDEQAAVNRALELEIARLENPARIAPLAQELGLVIPERTNQLLVDLEPTAPVLADAGSEGLNQ